MRIAALLLLSGKPINEPITSRRMNSWPHAKAPAQTVPPRPQSDLQRANAIPSRVRKPCASDIGEIPRPVKKWGFQGV